METKLIKSSIQIATMFAAILRMWNWWFHQRYELCRPTAQTIGKI